MNLISKFPPTIQFKSNLFQVQYDLNPFNCQDKKFLRFLRNLVPMSLFSHG